MRTVTGIVLAGGLGRRMGGLDKGLQPLRGKPMVLWAIERLAPQVDELIVNANQNRAEYERFGYRVVADEVGGFAGPLAGLHAGLKAARCPLAVTVPCDSPFLPRDLVARLKGALERAGAELAVAKTGDQAHPVFSLMEHRVLARLEAFLAAGGRKMDHWYGDLKTVEVAFDDQPDAFRNINTLDELKSS